MADVKISNLSAASALVGTEIIPCSDGSATTKGMTPAQLRTYIASLLSDMVIPGLIIGSNTGTKTMTSNTSSQALLNVSANGAVAVLGNTTYIFECLLSLSSMSATSGNAKFDLLGAGTATLTSQAYITAGMDGTTQTTAAAGGFAFNTASPSVGNIITAGTGTAMSALVKGIFRVNAAGTIIPSVALTTAASAVIGVNCYFYAFPIGNGSVQAVGTWT